MTSSLFVGECGNCSAEGLFGFVSSEYVDKDSRLDMLNDEVMFAWALARRLSDHGGVPRKETGKTQAQNYGRSMDGIE